MQCFRIYTQLFKSNAETGFTSKQKRKRALNLIALCNFTNIYYLQGPGTKGEGEMASHWQTEGLYWILGRNPSLAEAAQSSCGWPWIPGMSKVRMDRAWQHGRCPSPRQGVELGELSGSFQPKPSWDSVNQRLQEDLASIRFHLSLERKFPRSWVFLKLWMMGLFKLCLGAKNLSAHPEPDTCK